MPTPNPDALQRFCARLLRRSALSQEEQAAILALPSRAAQFPPRHDIVSPGQPTPAWSSMGSSPSSTR